MQFGGLEILLIFAIIFMFWGPKQLPKIADAFKKSKDIVKSDEKKSGEESGVGDAEE